MKPDTSPFRRSITILRDCLAPRRRLLAATFGVVVGFNLADILFPKLLQLFVDSVAGNPVRILDWSPAVLSTDTGRLFVFPAILLGLAGVRWVLTYARSVYETRLGQGALYDLRNRIFDTMQNLSFAYHDRTHSGTLISNVVEDVAHVSMFLTRGLFPTLEGGVYLLFAYAMLFSVCWPAALVSLGLLLFAGVAAGYFYRYGYGVFQKTRTLFSDTVSYFSESMEGQLLVRAFGRHPERIETYRQKVRDLHRARWREIKYATLLNQGFLYPATLGAAAVVATGLWLRQHGWDLTTGELFLIFLLQSTITHRTRPFSRGLDQWMRFMIAAERIGELFTADEYLYDPPRSDVGSWHPDDGCRIEMEDVSFAYGNDRTHSLNGVSLAIEPGQTVGFVGESGAGKSTLALVLCRFYDPDRGVVRIGGRDARTIPVPALRRQFALVFQDTFLFSASIRDNIAYGRPGACLEEIVHAATLAQIHDFIMSLPEGYDTEVGERGVTLSGGQRQRLAIARALLRRPRYLVLDDCTSALDTQTERAVQEGLSGLRRRTTTLVIAHRYSSIAEADVVYVLEHGRIVEQGAPADLDRPGTAFRRILQIPGEASA